MLEISVEKFLARWIAFGSTLVAIFIFSSPVTDPVNVTKLFALGLVAFGAMAIVLLNVRALYWREQKYLVFTALLFVFSMIQSITLSASPIIQNLYGDYGRNTGAIAYLLLLLLFISVTFLQKAESYALVVRALIVAGIINLVYCAWVLMFGDFIGWSNPYGEILGTFGNPNFIGAFLGIYVTVAYASLVKPDQKMIWRIIFGLSILVAGFEIHSSKAVQGVVVSLGGVALVTFFLIRAILKNRIISVAYVAFVFILGLFSILGALQIGPLAKLVYKVSVSLRGEYWAAGIRMGRDHLFSGIGMDSYGDYYRQYRDAGAMILPGPKVVSNAAHNVVIDFFAFGGLPLLISYLILLILSGLAAARLLARFKSFDFVSVSLISIWACYQVQSIISINQIGLAVWGWVSGGALIGYEKSTRAKNENRKVSSKVVISPLTISFVGAVIGGLVSVPPLAADMKWRSALLAQRAELVEAALEPSYLNPLNTSRFITAVDLFERSGMFEKSHLYATKAIEFNPRSFDAWRALYLVKNSSAVDRKLAISKMKELDPLNPDVTSVN